MNKQSFEQAWKKKNGTWNERGNRVKIIVAHPALWSSHIWIEDDTFTMQPMLTHSHEIKELFQQHGLTVHVEDPENTWHSMLTCSGDIEPVLLDIVNLLDSVRK